MSEWGPGPGSWPWGWFATPGDGNGTCCQSLLPSLLSCSLSQTNASQFREAALPLSSCSAVSRQLLGLKAWSFFSLLETLVFLISCPGTRPSSISPMLMAAHGSSVSYWQGSDIGWTPQGCLCKHQWKRGRVAFTCICLLGLLLPPQMPQPSRAMPAET